MVGTPHNDHYKNSAMNQSVDFDTIVVGAGFAGLYMLHRLLKIGHRVLVLEKGDGVGGISTLP